jgi:hypothetical protein
MENYEIDWICIPPNTLFYSNETSVLTLYTHSPTSHSLVKTKIRSAITQFLCDSRNRTTIPDGTEILKSQRLNDFNNKKAV